MEDIIAIRKDENLKQTAINIFGDIVEDAYITAWGVEYHTTQELQKTLDFKTHDYIDNKIDIADYIIIKFKNNKSVYFECSEWGSISNINLDTTTKEL